MPTAGPIEKTSQMILNKVKDSNYDAIDTIPINSLVGEAYDYISLGYTGANLTTVVYKTGGSGGTTVATLTLAYTGDVLDSITRT